MSDILEREITDLIKSNRLEKAFSLIMKGYQERIYWQVRRMVLTHENANDVSQNVFIKAWKGLENFKGDSKVSTWLYRISINESITFINKEKKKFVEGSDDYLEFVKNSLKSDEFYTGDEMETILQLAVASLPPKQQSVFNMKYFEDLKYDEIAEITGGSIGSLKASYHHATKKIEEFLKAY